MRIFGSDKIKSFMTSMGMKDDEPIEHKMISNAIAKAQKKVETHNFEIRKHLLEYDNVMNDQRKVIYRIRKDILGDNANREFINEMIEDVAMLFVDNYRPERKTPIDSWSWNEIAHGFKTTFHTTYELNLDECNKQYDGDIDHYAGEAAKRILDEKLSQYPTEQVKLAVREILLSTFDHHWKEHLLSMDHMKEGINLNAYAQKDPLTEYKRQGFKLFEEMRVQVKKALVNNIFSVKLYSQAEIEELQRRHQEELDAQLEAHRKQLEAAEKEKELQESAGKPLRRGEVKVGRNDACPCGSGKKFKHCHGT